VWFAEYNGNQIGRITTGGAIIEYPVPTASSWPYGITAGPDGNLWFTEYNVSQVGRITTGGAITEYPIPTAYSDPYGIVAGPDKRVWFTEARGKIGAIRPTAG
jgi:virginiamycin B lyase